MSKKQKYSSPALEKGLDILEYLAEARSPQSLSNIAQGLGRSSNELFRMIVCLEERGYLIRDPVSEKYHLSLRPYLLAHSHNHIDYLKNAAKMPMRELAEAVMESCHLSIMNRNSLLVIAQEESPKNVRLSIEVGGEFSLVKTVSGRLLLSDLPEAELQEVLQDEPEYQRWDSSLQHKFRDRLRKIREQRYATAENELTIGVHDIAVLVGDMSVGITAALTIAYLIPADNGAQHKEYLEALLYYGNKINQNLGIPQ